ncbi:MAG: OTU domain-containing protein [Gammaproteobacteria bacterium]
MRPQSVSQKVSSSIINLKIGGTSKTVEDGFPYTKEQVYLYLLALDKLSEDNPTKTWGILYTYSDAQVDFRKVIQEQLEKDVFKNLKSKIRLFPVSALKDDTREVRDVQLDDARHFFSREKWDSSEVSKVMVNLGSVRVSIITNDDTCSEEDRKHIADTIDGWMQDYPPEKIFVDISTSVQKNLSTQAKVLTATNNYPTTSAVAPTPQQSKAVNFVDAISNIKKNIQIGGATYELKFDDAAIAAKSTHIKVELFKQGQSQSQGSFTVSQDKITANTMTVEIAFAMMKAYMETNPGQEMEIKPKDKAAHQFFVDAAEKLKDKLDISYTICAVDGAGKVEVRVSKSVTPKVAVPKQKPEPNPVEPIVPVASSPSTSTASSSPKLSTPTHEQPVSTVSPVVPSPSSKHEAQSLPDGNCLFNSFALGLLEIKQSGLPVSRTLKDFIEKNNDIFALTDPDAFQKRMAAVLRERAIALAYTHSAINKFELQIPLFVACDQYRSYLDKLDKNKTSFDDDIFLQHQFIKDKFGEKYLSKDSLIAWWQNEGYDLFLTEMKGNAKWAGDLELAELANYFDVNVNIAGSNDVPVSHLYAAKLSMVNVKLSEMEKNQLIELGVTRVSSEANAIPIALTASQLQDRVKAIGVIIDNIQNSDISPFDNELIVLGIYARRADGEVLRRDPRPTAELLHLYRKIFPQLDKFNEKLDQYPTISLKHRGNHWDVMRAPDRGVAASPSNKAR